jgi:hypothetical protein
MNKNLLALFTGLFFSMLVLFWVNNSLSAETENAPIIHVDKTTHIFQPVFEGEELSHTFTVFNKGRSELHIKKVTHD